MASNYIYFHERGFTEFLVNEEGPAVENHQVLCLHDASFSILDGMQYLFIFVDVRFQRPNRKLSEFIFYIHTFGFHI